MQLIDCPAQLNIIMVDSFKATLQGAIDIGGTCRLNAEGVEKVDSTGLQLLLSFKVGLEAVGGRLEWQACSEPLRVVAHTVGLGEALGLPN